MGNMVEQKTGSIAVLDNYAQQGRYFLNNAAQSLIQFGRVLCEAKPLVPHGQFENWIADNFGMSKSTAEQYMRVWKRFGTTELLANVQYSKLREMLALPAGTEQEFAETHDIADMTVREVKQAVQAETGKAKETPVQPEPAAATEQDDDDGVIAELKTKLEAANKLADERSEQLRDEISNRSKLQADLNAAKAELDDAKSTLKGLNEQYNKQTTELLNLQSQVARGDAERTVHDALTAEDFAAAVRSFMGSVFQLPGMTTAFAVMPEAEKRVYSEHMDALEDWMRGARKAMNAEVLYFAE